MITRKFFFALTLNLCVTSTQAASTYDVTEVTNGGSISGRVLFQGKDPDPVAYKITQDSAVCGTGKRLIDYVKVNHGGLADVVVYLEKVPAGKPFDKNIRDREIDQVNCEFLPFLQIVANEDSLKIKNSDSILHNVHAYEILGKRKKTLFNVSQPNIGANSKKIKLRRGKGVKIECDAHDFMFSFAFVARNPYYARVDKEGNFVIENIPPGIYSIRTFHGTLKDRKAKIEVEAGKRNNINFTIEGR